MKYKVETCLIFAFMLLHNFCLILFICWCLFCIVLEQERLKKEKEKGENPHLGLQRPSRAPRLPLSPRGPAAQ